MQSRLAFNIKIVSENGEELIIGCASICLFENDGRLVTGYQEIGVWPFMSIDSDHPGIDPFLGKLQFHETCKICLQFDSYASEVYYSIHDTSLLELMKIPSIEVKTEGPPTTEELVKVNSILTRDNIDPPMTEIEKRLMVRSKDYLKEVANSLTYYLAAVTWTNPAEVADMAVALKDWHADQGFSQYVILLDGRFHNEAVRNFAVHKLETMTDSDL